MTQKELFRFGEWTIRKWNTFEGSYVVHEPCTTTMETGVLSLNPECCECDMRIPEEVLGVWVLLNFDRIAENRQEFEGGNGWIP